MGVDIERRYSAGLSDAGAIFQQVQNLPSSSDDIARIAGLPMNPLTGPQKDAADKILSGIKNTALNIAKKTVKGVVSTGVGAATSLTVGASIGNLIPIPGIGAAIGAIGALVFEGFKALGKLLLKALKPKPQPFQRKCPKYNCPEPPQMAIVDLLPWIAQQEVVVGDALVKQRKKEWCGFGGVDDCSADLSYLRKEAFKIIIPTIPYLGLPQIDRLLAAYYAMPKQHAYYGARPGKQAELTQVAPTEYRDVILHMESRQKSLRDLMARARQVTTMPGNQVPKLRWDLVTELTKAATQVQIAQGPETISWYRMLGEAVLQLLAREQSDSARMKAQSEDAARRAKDVAADPRRQMQHNLDIARMQCGEGIQAKCEEARRLAAMLGGGPAPAPAPARPGPTQQRKTSAELQALAQARNKYVFEYLQRLAQQGNPAAVLLFTDAARQPGQFPFAKTYNYLERKSQEGVKPAQLILYSAVREFQSKVRGAQV
jgi:hypothetical protein